MRRTYPQDHWNETRELIPDWPTLHARVRQQADATPDAIAVRCQGFELSYRQLNGRANQLAAHLRALGATPGALIGISLARSLDMAVAVLAVLKCGAAYVPLDPAYPAQRLAAMLEDADCPLLIGTQRHRPLFAFQGRFVALDDDAALIAAQSDADRDPAADGESLAYVIYTSGSTGRPKGVEIRHRNVVNFVAAVHRLLGTSPADTFLAVSSLSFDMSVLDLFVGWCAGACVELALRETAANPVLLLQWLRSTRATVMQATPATWKMLVDAGLSKSAGLTAVVGGDALPSDLAEALAERCAAVWNFYGPTETTVYSTAHRYSGGRPLIGRPLANTQIFILDEHGEPVETGATGEICIAGAGVGRGYLHRPDLTAQAFVANPFRDASEDPMYRSGDVGRYRPDGDIECLGRIDRQVKILGHRIELGEIECRLRLHPSIRDAIVTDAIDSSGQKSLIAHYVTQGPGVSEPALREHLRLALPDFMVPAILECLDVLPLTPNGKVDRGALAPATMRAAARTARQHPGLGPTEEALTRLWSEALRRPQIGLRDNFFEAGGHSLMAVQLTMRIEEHFGLVVPLDALWNEGSTIAGMASLLQRLKDLRVHSRLVQLRPGEGLPLFVMHTLRGSVNEYQAFASHLDIDCPVIGVRSKGLYGDRVPESTISQYAADAVDAIRGAYPEGPYMLAGYSIGGLIAFEAANQLTRLGQEVTFLGLFDAPAPGDRAAFAQSASLRRYWRSLNGRLKRLLESPAGAGAGDDAAQDRARSATHPSLISRHAFDLFDSLKRAEETYRPSAKCAVPLTLFAASNPGSPDARLLLGWDRFAAAGVRLYQIDAADHSSFMTGDSALELARSVAAALSVTVGHPRFPFAARPPGVPAAFSAG